jgi:hypothetical protein
MKITLDKDNFLKIDTRNFNYQWDGCPRPSDRLIQLINALNELKPLLQDKDIKIKDILFLDKITMFVLGNQLKDICGSIAISSVRFNQYCVVQCKNGKYTIGQIIEGQNNEY